MAKEWAKSFYQSKQWINVRNYIMARSNYICERCNTNPAEIVHHIIWLNPSNINNPDITLSQNNLIAVCRNCHAEIHEGVSATVDGFIFNSDGELERIQYGSKNIN